MRLLDKQGGVATYTDVDELTGEIKIITEQDVSGFLDRMKRLRETSSERWQKGVKEEWMHYASIPTIVIMQLKEKGIDVFCKDDEKRMLSEINRNYPYLKTVDHKNHE